MTPESSPHGTARRTAVLLLALVMATVVAVTQARQAGGWKPVEGKLLSRFARDVAPASPCRNTRARSSCDRPGSA